MRTPVQVLGTEPVRMLNLFCECCGYGWVAQMSDDDEKYSKRFAAHNGSARHLRLLSAWQAAGCPPQKHADFDGGVET